MGNESGHTSAAHFHTTRWTLIDAAQPLRPDAEAALERLCAIYWRPIYAFLRRLGRSAHDAQDLTQDFFALVLRREMFARVTRGPSRFRSFLLTALRNHLADHERTRLRQKRGGGALVLSLDAFETEEAVTEKQLPASEAEAVFDRRWAELVVERALARLRESYAHREQQEMFDALRAHLTGVPGAEATRAAGEALGLSPEQLSTALSRLRKRFRAVVREEVALTVAEDADVDDELRYLLRALA